MSNKKPLFSILIANYNNSNYLLECLDSVYKQTYDNWEVIIVDDASSDLSSDLYKELCNNKRLTICVNDKNYGCGYTKRKCIELAHGEIAGFLDPDDMLTINALQVMVDEHLQNPQASLVYSTYYKCDDKMNVEYINTSSKKIPIATDYLHYQQGAVHAFASFKVEKYRMSEGLNPLFLRAVDQNLYYLLEEQGDLVFHNEPLYYYRFHNRSISIFQNTYKARYWHLIAIYEACVRRGIVQDSEQIASDLLKINIGDVEIIKQKLNEFLYPSFKMVLKVIYRWICRK